jgi:hypothetical protein
MTRTEIEAIKANTRPILDSLGIESRSGRYYCPLCQPNPADHKTPDMSVRGAAIKCHRCGWKGDILRLYCDSRNVGFADALNAIGDKRYDAPKHIRHVDTSTKAKPVYSMQDQAERALQSQMRGWEIVHIWLYVNERDFPTLFVYRFERDGEKSYRPIAKVKDGWVIGKARGKQPIYNLPDIMCSLEDPVFVVEGEKAADALIAIGILATTSPFGANNAGKADWTALKDRRVIVWPDNDEPGHEFAKTIKGILPQAEIFTPPLPNEGDDAYDWVNGRTDTKELITELRELYKKHRRKECTLT